MMAIWDYGEPFINILTGSRFNALFSDGDMENFIKPVLLAKSADGTREFDIVEREKTGERYLLFDEHARPTTGESKQYTPVSPNIILALQRI